MHSHAFEKLHHTMKKTNKSVPSLRSSDVSFRHCDPGAHCSLFLESVAVPSKSLLFCRSDVAVLSTEIQ
jgi:hypothetical protein